MEFQLDKALEILSRTPDSLGAMLRGLPDDWTTGTEGPETWSPFDVVGHLIHGERTDWIPRARMILDHGDSRTFEPFDRFAQLEENKGGSLSGLLETFRSLRAANLETLKGLGLTSPDLERKGRHPDLGIVTLGQLLATWVVHDLGHLGQISRVLANQYASEVGPWRDFLPILGRSSPS